MALITWSGALEVGVPEIDEQHQKLVAIVNALHDAMMKGQAHDVMGRLLDEVVDYTVYHFAAEQRLFAETRYPRGPEHEKMHDELTATAKKIRADVSAGKSVISHEVMRFLRDWLQQHIVVEDKAFGRYVNGAK
jgi:hemerythrin-like metal-binding protein